MLDFETTNSISEVSKSNSWKITSFSKIITSEGAVSNNVIYYQPFPITRYKLKEIMQTIIVSHYRQWPVPLKGRTFLGERSKRLIQAITVQRVPFFLQIYTFNFHCSKTIAIKTELQSNKLVYCPFLPQLVKNMRQILRINLFALFCQHFSKTFFYSLWMVVNTSNFQVPDHSSFY